MTDRPEFPTRRKRAWLRYVAIGVAALVFLLGASVLVAKRMSDGPLTEMIPGGALQAGPLEAGAGLAAALTCGTVVCPKTSTIELELVGPATSRYTGIMVHDGQVYIPCDLGFMWGRFTGTTRSILHLIYLFKHWHEDALQDGRVVIRAGGKRYEGQAVKVTDPSLDTALRSQLEEMAKVWVAPDTLGPPPTEPPNDIWFFRIDPRGAS